MMKTEKSIWKTTLEITPTIMRLLVTEATGDVLKAEFRAYPDHIRALMFILEGLALYSGHPLSVAIIAEPPVDHSLGLGMAADIAEILRFASEEDADKLVLAGSIAFMQSLTRKTWMRGLFDLIDMIDNPEYGASRFAKDRLATLAPPVQFMPGPKTPEKSSCELCP